MKEFKIKKKGGADEKLERFAEVGIYDNATQDQIDLTKLVDLDELTKQLKEVNIPKGRWLQITVDIKSAIVVPKTEFKRK